MNHFIDVSIKRSAFALIAFLLVWSAPGVTGALAQNVSYPDSPGYEKFRLSEQETLEALHNDPTRELSFRLLVCQRRLREAQLMIAKGKLDTVPGLIKEYQETVEGTKAFIQTLPLGSIEPAEYFETVEIARRRQQEVLKNMVREVPVDLHPAIESAMATSQQLRVHLVRTLPGEAGSTDAGQTGTRRATIQEPLSPEEAASAEIQPLQPLYPESATGAEIRQPPKTIRPLTQQEGRRLRPGETDPRGTRRPGDTSPRPRARDEDR